MSKKNTPAERLYNGIVKENPTFVLTLGMCPTLAVTTSAVNGLGMGGRNPGEKEKRGWRAWDEAVGWR